LNDAIISVDCWLK